MLLLTRKRMQTIHIGDNIKITVIKGSGVQLGIDAPREVPIRRGELPPIDEKNDAA